MGGRTNRSNDSYRVGDLVIITFILILSFCVAAHLTDDDESHSSELQRLLDREHMGSLRPYDWELENN